MKKSITKMLAAFLCVAGIGTASAAESYTRLHYEGSRTQYYDNHGNIPIEMKVVNGIPYAYGYDKATNKLSFVDAYETSNSLDRIYRIRAYGAKRGADLYSASTGYYGFGVWNSSSSVTDGSYITWEKKVSASKGGTITLTSSEVNSLIFTGAKNLGYRAVFIGMDSLGWKLGSQPSYTTMIPLANDYARGGVAAYSSFFRLPAEGSVLFFKNYRDEKYTTYAAMINTDYVGVTRDTAFLRVRALVYDSIHEVRLESRPYRYNASGTVQDLGWTGSSNGSLWRVISADTAWGDFTINVKNKWILPGDSAVQFRARFVTKVTDNYGIPVYDTTYSTIANLRAEYSKDVRTFGCENTMGTITVGSKTDQVRDAAPYVAAGTKTTYTAVPKTGYRFKGWYKNTSTKLASSETITIKTVCDTSIFAWFEEIPKTARLYVNTATYDGAIVSTADTSKSSFFMVPGVDSIKFSMGVGGTNKRQSFVLQYANDGGAWVDLYRYYSIAGEVLMTKIYDSYVAIGTDGKFGARTKNGQELKSDAVRGNNYTLFRLKSYYSDTEDSLSNATAYSKNICVYWRYPIVLQKKDGSQLSRNIYAYNATLTFPTNKTVLGIPEGDANSSYTYNWVNVNNTSEKPSGSLTVTKAATYKIEVNAQYRVKFVDYDGTSLKDNMVDEYTAASAPANPNHQGNTTDYKFSKWDKTYSNVTAPLTVNAVYTNRVTFKGKDGASTLGSTQWILKGGAAVAPAAPAVEGFAFKGWDKDFSNVQDSMTVTAQYVAIPEINFTIKADAITANMPALVASRALTALPECMSLSGWKSFYKINSVIATTVGVQIADTDSLQNGQTYAFAFAVNVSRSGSCADNEFIKQIDEVMAIPGAVLPVYINYAPAGLFSGNSMDIRGYNLNGGSDVVSLKNDKLATFAVVYRFAPALAYVIEFFQADGKTSISKSVVKNDVMPTAPAASEVIVPANTDKYTYSFKGWSPIVAKATANVNYVAQIDSVLKTYTVKFVDYNGSQIGSAQTVGYGKSATAPSNPKRTGYVFAGWDGDYKNIVTTTTITATYKQVPAVEFTATGMVSGNDALDVVAPSECFSINKAAGVYNADGDALKMLGEDMVDGESYYWQATVTMNSTGDCAEDELVKSIVEIAAYSDAVIPVTVNGVVSNANIKSSTASFSVKYSFTATEASVIESSSGAEDPASSGGAGIASSGDAEDPASSGGAEIASSGDAEDSSSSGAVESSSGAEDPASSSEAKSSSSVKSSSSAKSSSSVKSSSSAKSSSSSKGKSSSSAKSSSSKDKDALVALSQLPHFNVAVNGRTVIVSAAKVGAKLAVLDMQGRVITIGTVDAANFSMTMPRAGMYMVRIGSDVQKFAVR